MYKEILDYCIFIFILIILLNPFIVFQLIILSPVAILT